MMRVNRWGFLFLIGFFILAGCQKTVLEVSSLSRVPKDQIRCYVDGLSVVFNEPMIDDNSGLWLDVPMSQQIKRWFESRFLPAGDEKKAYIVIQKAVLKEESLPRAQGWTSFFSKQPSERYTADIEVRFEMRDALGFAEQFASAQVCKTAHVLEGADLSERQRIVQTLVSEVIEMVDHEIIKNMEELFPLLLEK